jgi:hypothetical protein
VSDHTLGYIVVEWNQASGRPEVEDGSLYSTAAEAEEAAQDARDFAAKVGRKERYTVAEVVEVTS